MMKKYISYSDWKNDQSPTNQKIIDFLEEVIINTESKFQKTVKWGQGCFTIDNNPRVFLHTEPDYVQLGFYEGSKLKDKYKLLEGNGKYVRHVKIYNSEKVGKTKLQALIKQVIN